MPDFVLIVEPAEAMSRCTQLSPLVGTFNSHEWRGHAPRTAHITCVTGNQLACSVVTSFEVGESQLLKVVPDAHRLVDFNEFDFGEPIATRSTISDNPSENSSDQIDSLKNAGKIQTDD